MSAETVYYAHANRRCRLGAGSWIIDRDFANPTINGAICSLRHDEPAESDPVNMPSHYTKLKVECIEVTEHFGFCLGNVLKYVWRADYKGKPIEDLKKARFYLDREIARRERESSDTM